MYLAVEINFMLSPRYLSSYDYEDINIFFDWTVLILNDNVRFRWYKTLTYECMILPSKNLNLNHDF